MIIGFDAKRLFHNDTGLGMYSRLLVQGLHEIFPKEQYILFAQSPSKSRHREAFETLPIVSSDRPLWRSWGMTREIKQLKCDLFHGLSHELPIGIKKTGSKSIVTIHDLIFKTDPQLYPVVDRLVYNLKWKHSCHQADRIIAVSEHTKRDICHYYQVAPDRISVIPPPVTQITTSLDPQETLSQYSLPEQFYLSVGSLTPRKNVLGILKAMLTLSPGNRIPLVIVGQGSQKAALQNFVKKHHLEKLVIFVGHISNDQLANFYQLAHALIYPWSAINSSTAEPKPPCMHPSSTVIIRE
jgi:glycosyltransferase involved in cell wall biosynthesis